MRGHELLVGEPVELGGDDRGPMPTELLASALASCMTFAVQFVAAKRGSEVPGLEVSVEAAGPGREPRYGELTVTVEADLERDELQALVDVPGGSAGYPTRSAHHRRSTTPCVPASNTTKAEAS